MPKIIQPIGDKIIIPKNQKRKSSYKMYMGLEDHFPARILYPGLSKKSILMPGNLSPSASEAGFDKTSLISWWDLDEESGMRYDAHGDNDLTDNNTVLYATGKVGNAADFVRVNTEYLSIVDNPSLRMGVGVYPTMGCWVKFDDAQGTNGYDLFFGKATDPSYEYTIYRELSQLRFAVWDPYADVTSTATISIGVWYFVVCWYDGTNIYIQVDNGDIDSVAFSADIYAGNGEFEIGAREGILPLDGKVDSAFLFKRVLSADERTWLYNAGAGRQYSDL